MKTSIGQLQSCPLSSKPYVFRTGEAYCKTSSKSTSCDVGWIKHLGRVIKRWDQSEKAIVIFPSPL